MGWEEEIETRVRIAEQIKERIKDAVETVLLSGDVGMRSSKVNAQTRMDLPIIICPKQLPEFLSALKLRVPATSAGYDFEYGYVHSFRIVASVDGVTVACYVHSAQQYADFVSLAADSALVLLSPVKPEKYFDAVCFDGNTTEVRREISGAHSGFYYTMPALANGKWYMPPIRQDFFHSCVVLFDRESRWVRLRERVWEAAISHLKTEGGGVIDSSQRSIAKAHSTAHKDFDRVPKRVLDEIVRETEHRLARKAL